MLRAKGGLGKGLGALIPISAPQVAEVDIDAIMANPRQPRHTLDPLSLEELANSIREHGVMQPLLVTQTTAEDRRVSPSIRYQLIAGERRWQAARLAGLTRVPAIVKEVTPEQSLQLALVENIQRADLTPLEEAAAFRQLVDEFGLTQERVAAVVGKDRASVANALRLLNLPEEVKAALASNQISEGHARALLGLKRREDQLTALAVVTEKGLSVRQVEELVRRAEVSPRPVGGKRVSTPHTQALEDEFRTALGTRVSLFRSSKGGRLVIHFYSDDQLQAIYDLVTSH